MIKQFKQNALNVLRGRWDTAIVGIIIFLLIEVLIQEIQEIIGAAGERDSYFTVLFASILSIAIMPLLYGLIKFFMEFRNGNTPFSIMFSFYTNSDMLLKSIGLSVLVGLYTFLWSLLLIIPGIIAAYSYSMAPFILIDNPDIGVSEAIRRSKEIMRGHKFDYFVLQLSFIGWAILACLTFGIGFLWLIPYILLTSIEFYRYIRDEYMYKQQTLENNANMNKGW